MKRIKVRKIIGRLIALIICIPLLTGSLAVAAFAFDGALDAGSTPAEIEAPQDKGDAEATDDTAETVAEEAAEDLKAEVKDAAEEPVAEEPKEEAEAKPEGEAEEVKADSGSEAAKEETKEEPKAEAVEENKEAADNTAEVKEAEKKAREDADKKYERALSKPKLTGDLNKDLFAVALSQVGREEAWNNQFVIRLLEIAQVKDVKINSAGLDKWIEDITKEEAKSIEAIQKNLELAAKGKETQVVKLVSYRHYDYYDASLSDLVFFTANENGKPVLKIGIYSENNFKKDSKGVANHKKGTVTLITGDEKGNVVEKEYYVVDGFDKNDNPLEIHAAEEKEEMEKAKANISKALFLSEKEIVIDGVVSVKAEEFAIKAAENVEPEVEQPEEKPVTIKPMEKTIPESLL